MTHSINFLTYYVAKRFGGTQTEVEDRRKILAFKNGDGSVIWDAAVAIGNAIIDDDNFRAGRFICLPAHDERTHYNRYREFSEIVSKLAGLVDDFDSVHFEGERLAIHNEKNRRQIDMLQCCRIDVRPGERYILFDDIYTTGHTFESVADYIEKRGGVVIGGYFLGKTKRMFR